MNKVISALLLMSLTIMMIAIVLSCQPIPSSNAPAASSQQPAASLSIEQYLEQGSIAYEKGQYEQALQDYTKAVELNPRNAKAYYERSKIHFHKGDLDKVIADCNRTLELDSNNLEVYYIRGIAYIRQKQYSKATNDLNVARGLEITEKESASLKELMNLAVPVDELILLGAGTTSQRTGICNEAICYAPIAFNVTLTVDLFVNPGKSGTTVSSINVSPDIEGKSQIDARRFFSNSGIQGFSVNISSLVPASSKVSYSANYKSGNDFLYKKSNSINQG